ncbi:MAG: ATP-binding protein [Roseateles sp.]|uniref:Fic family protein n=1 Tax=Roseateles sp. TaxID=1971397 RepID=UPI0039E8D287
MTEAELLQLIAGGEDSRHQFKRDEIQRLFQRSGLIYADVIPVECTSVADLDEKAFDDYFTRRYGQSPQASGQPLPQVLQNIGLGDGQELNLAGLLLFGKRPQRYRPAFMVKAVAFPGTSLASHHYLDSEDIDGTLLAQYQRSLAFIKRNLHHVQGDQNFNSLGLLEVPEQAIIELLVNALIHRDYFTSASIRLLVFADRIEIISPGHLPDSLSVEDIRLGVTNRRNPTLTEHATQILPYRGLGSGIPRALGEWPDIRFESEVRSNQFRAVILRPVTGRITTEVTTEVERVLRVLIGEMSRQELQEALALKNDEHFRKAYLLPALGSGLVEMTLPSTPRSSKQRYRLTAIGRRWLESHPDGNSA